jgi:hypothetical protein
VLGFFDLTLCKLERCLYGSLLRSLFFRLGSYARCFFGLALCGFLGKALCVLATKFY